MVVDPVMVATSGAKLMGDDALEALKTELLPLATLVTPNIPEAEILSGIKILSEKDMERAAKKIFEQYGSAVCTLRGPCHPYRCVPIRCNTCQSYSINTAGALISELVLCMILLTASL